MMDLYYWPTPNGHKITIFLEESGLPYKLIPVNIFKGEQFSEDFLRISPNNRIPALIDHHPKDSKPISIFESGAILLYLAEKTGQFLPQDVHDRYEVLQWLFWQVGGLGPMAGQNHHFSQHARDLTYAVDRYVRETARLYGVLNKHLADQEFIVNEYSIADMACYPWIVSYEKQQQNLDDFPNLKRWFLNIRERPAVQRAYDAAKDINVDQVLSEEAKQILFNQGKKA
ncbi:glutathione S-transferase N-terminal domain-containing protein [Fluoribacter dumoffii]|uniref:glutathione S-transferase N-terminal domain-containing protein n=1 Tax=Fluoribacter dumoffii TaxID=463 RepID=UPI0022449B2C|nr:glutathione S-transferase N-terminal domain-containing protein [Fluoribacter dumoffii]MCW8418879.1 glutathione S-transferase N-terminal domain-containing protein [Fluoribacter dumoffii]MCW8453277.1 glutathione S-transferase N-terminal domain-containing protein [Fluoribacter dumoffii]MCW8459502.1 glutathione S-transferase N-terminal domain-containing protein [Fluoribacter dumoffii]MCW8482862.1 glutathione S-transferase N-terminal domain-containing protein [Fluoribacter dumoffii]